MCHPNCICVGFLVVCLFLVLGFFLLCVFFFNKSSSCMVYCYVECISVIWWVICTPHRLSMAKARYDSFTSPPAEIPVYDCQNWLFSAEEATVILVAFGFPLEGSLEACFVICWFPGKKKIFSKTANPLVRHITNTIVAEMSKVLNQILSCIECVGRETVSTESQA